MGLRKDDVVLTLKELKGQKVHLELQMLVVDAGIARLERLADKMPDVEIEAEVID